VRHKDARHNGEARNEIGPERTSPNNDFAAGRMELTEDLVKLAEAKLVGLHASRSQLRRRIRALHYLLKTIDAELTDSKPTARLSQLPTRESAFNPVGERESNSAAAATSSIATEETTSGALAVTGVSTELRRACRIALMESDHPQCCEQILQRIRRRESVCVQGFHDPMIEIAQELRKMLADGEVTQKRDNQFWQLNRDSDPIARRNFAGK
jgi:hypothetical protein